MDQFDPLTAIAHALGIDPLFLAGLVPFAILFFNLLGRAIPDDAVGVLGFIRKVAKVLGLYLSNRVSSGVSINKVVQVAAGIKPIDEVPALAEKLADAEPPALELTPEQQIKPLFPGVARGADGKFVSLKNQGKKE